MHAIEYMCVRTNTDWHCLTSLICFCVLFDIVLMCGMSHERDIGDVFVCPMLVVRPSGGRVVRASIYFCTVEHRCVQVDSSFIAKSVLANLAFGGTETAAR